MQTCISYSSNNGAWLPRAKMPQNSADETVKVCTGESRKHRMLIDCVRRFFDYSAYSLLHGWSRHRRPKLYEFRRCFVQRTFDVDFQVLLT